MITEMRAEQPITVNTAHQLGGALGISVLVTVFAAAGGGGDAHALTHGVASALTGSVVFIAAALWW